ncbi:CidA/LrgA family protein [Alicyclobacillus fastidiosus]|uniref:CidA/LrgA family protein n=1 Tax=Alicyclobacillus fastidiosus TaxID=392011 RepID=A0ABY6ZRJ0_9BACL|nr:CidA/LrgA family protein [Alicyclobacillus fastidiosus]WAH44714.1 CidA/LrgA family protein [Alicyclobacillus fastidiosus]GMA62715.1 holin-like protein CidA [Alicyclobacillus fastidiosus]
MRFLKLVAQIAGLYGLSEIGTLISRWTHIPVPGSIWGLVLLFVLLKCRVIQLRFVEAGGDWLIREMLLFFVPSAAGIMTYGHLLFHQGLQIVVVIVASTSLVMLSTGLVAENITRWRKHRDEKRDITSC